MKLDGNDFRKWITKACGRYPERTAIEKGSNCVSYAALAARANETAEWLTDHQLRPGSIVAVLVEDRVDLIAVVLGIFTAGCVFVPVGVDWPVERQREVFTDLCPDAVVLGASQQRLLDEVYADRQVLFKTLVFNESARHCQEVESPVRLVGPSRGAPDAMSYIYYTSGTTGKPKWIAGKIESLSNFIKWEVRTFNIRVGWRVSQLTVPTFDAFFRDVLVPLCVGGTICIPPDSAAALTPKSLLQWIDASGINLLHCVPTLLLTLLRADSGKNRLAAMKLVLLSGEFLPVSCVKLWQKRFGSATQFVNLYGATEATMIQFFHLVQKFDLEKNFIPIGKTIDGVEGLLLDTSGHVCPPGVVGEIFIKSTFLSLGYYRNPEATAKAFIPNPLDRKNNEKVYRTGDLAVRLEDGSLKLLGRTDTQVKIHGVRVEPDGVSAVLHGHPDVASSVVLAVENEVGKLVLVAYIIPATQYPPGIPELRSFLRRFLPWEMIPAHFVYLTKFPLLESGKIDRASLPVLQRTVTVPVSPDTVEDAELQRELKQLWCEVLQVEKVGLSDHFFDLGGHSLSAMQLASRLEPILGMRVSVRDIFNYPTVAELSRFLGDSHGRKNEINTAQPAPVSEGRPEIIPDAQKATMGDEKLQGQLRLPSFQCSRAPSLYFGRRDCNLVLVVNEQLETDSFERVKTLIHGLDRRVSTTVMEDRPNSRLDLVQQPTLIFSPALIRYLPIIRGVVCCGNPMSKSEEYTALEGAGIPVPPWVLFSEHNQPDISHLGNYVVRKPDYGAKGAEVRIVRRERVRWKPINTFAAGPSASLIVQRFIYTGLHPVSYRVNTLFGKVLYAIRLKANSNRPTLLGSDDFKSKREAGVSIVSNARDSEMVLCFDEKIIQFAERAHAAFPGIPLLGVDILREEPSGQLYVAEVNATGYNWNFSSHERAQWPVDIENQFQGVEKAAYLLAEYTQRFAG